MGRRGWRCWWFSFAATVARGLVPRGGGRVRAFRAHERGPVFERSARADIRWRMLASRARSVGRRSGAFPPRSRRTQTERGPAGGRLVRHGARCAPNSIGHDGIDTEGVGGVNTPERLMPRSWRGIEGRCSISGVRYDVPDTRSCITLFGAQTPSGGSPPARPADSFLEAPVKPATAARSSARFRSSQAGAVLDHGYLTAVEERLSVTGWVRPVTLLGARDGKPSGSGEGFTRREHGHRLRAYASRG